MAGFDIESGSKVDFRPTDEQAVIEQRYRETGDNLIISALAGSGKTSTLKLLANVSARESKLLVVFNKSVKDEIEPKLYGTNTTVMTLNGLGHQIWKLTLSGTRLELDANKMWEIVKRRTKDVKWAEIESAAGGDYSIVMTLKRAIVATVRRVIKAWRADCYVPNCPPCATSHMTDKEARAAVGEAYDEKLRGLGPDLFAQIISVARQCLDDSISAALEGFIDYDDQTYMPAIWNDAHELSFDTIMLDEAQDVSRANMALMLKVNANRIVAVGDRNQAIYAWRGAMSNSLDIMKESFGMVELPLSMCFRCGTAIIEHVHQWVPHMTWPEGQHQGDVVYADEDTAFAMVHLDDAIICYRNAPLMKMAIRLMRERRPFTYRKLESVSEALIGKIEAVKSYDDPIKELGKRHKEQVDKLKADGDDTQAAEDAYEAVLAVMDGAGRDCKEAVKLVEKMREGKTGITLATAHTSKGGEWDRVWLLNYDQMIEHLVTERMFGKEMTEEQIIQHRNLCYVACTRAKKTLNLC